MTAVLSDRKGVPYRAFVRLDTVSGVVVVEFPDLPNCSGSGGDFVQALDRAKRALDSWIDASLRRGQDVPAVTDRKPARPAALEVWIAARSAFQQRGVLSPPPSS